MASGLHRTAQLLQGRVGWLKRQWVWAQRKLPLGCLCSKHRHSPWLPLHVITAVAVGGIQLPQWLSGKESACNVGDAGLILGSGRSPGEGNGNPLQYSCMGNPMDRGSWWATVHGIATELDMIQWLNNNCCWCYWVFTEYLQCATHSVTHFIFLRQFPFYLFIFVCARSLLPCWLSLAATSSGNSLAAVHGLLIAVAYLVVEYRLQGMQVSSSCSSQA